MENTLKQILQEMKHVNTRLGKIEEGQKNLEDRQKNLEKRQENLEIRQMNLEEQQKEMRHELIGLKEGQERFQKNMIESIGLYTDKIIEHVDVKTSALNKRLYTLEVEVERLQRQKDQDTSKLSFL
ncbi:chaperonin cofactor prefoldin [Oikeobacillus pervagus]|uniref:Chaperonin cofactor prefoldin n=1 Tax=Oikeobacillus pervagus TaxID=1325931 RepID=A0AAJ1T2V2_9BACI|nr:hypothetical protein [Oikeobacillus pervagus]MDQ0214914.1 chaperonin cofactor prefoldin [Oikeobacillus pervagus]